jgi:hypothetical protein
MGQLDITAVHCADFELRFRSLFNDGCALVFACDEDGQVDMDAMSERARENYLVARALLGRHYAYPIVRRRLY